MPTKTVVVIRVPPTWTTEESQAFFAYIDQAVADGKTSAEVNHRFYDDAPLSRFERTWTTLEHAQDYVTFVQTYYSRAVESIELLPA